MVSAALAMVTAPQGSELRPENLMKEISSMELSEADRWAGLGQDAAVHTLCMHAM